MVVSFVRTFRLRLANQKQTNTWLLTDLTYSPQKQKKMNKFSVPKSFSHLRNYDNVNKERCAYFGKPKSKYPCSKKMKKKSIQNYIYNLIDYSLCKDTCYSNWNLSYNAIKSRLTQRRRWCKWCKWWNKCVLNSCALLQYFVLICFVYITYYILTICMLHTRWLKIRLCYV